MQTIALLLHTVLCGVLGWSAWCRLVKMNSKRTVTAIRLSFTLAAMGAIALGVAPWGAALWPMWFPAYRPHVMVIVMLAGFVAVQVSTSKYWKHGAPASFCKE